MKYGLLVNKSNENIGDDIQSYAEAQFLPKVDVMVDRENLDVFKYGKGTEPVAVIMGAWFMWKKFNWPPAKQIIPLTVGYHHFDREKDVFKSSSYAVPIFSEHYQGIGGQWFKDHGKVGCRDYHTCEVFDKNGIPNYFSGCVTLTLPKQKKTKDNGKYIVLVDLNEEVEKKVRSLVGDKYEIRKISHTTPKIADATWEERAERVEEFLTLYQNAKYVVTRRLHVALPCLAMEVPVMVIQSVKMNDPNRFDPYNKWLHYARNHEFLKNGYPDFDFQKGTPNKKDYLKTREELTNTIKDFIKHCEENKNKPLEFFVKTTYSDEELYKWRTEFMKNVLLKTHMESKRMHNSLVKENKKSLIYIAIKRFYTSNIMGKNIEKNRIIQNLKCKFKRNTKKKK